MHYFIVSETYDWIGINGILRYLISILFAQYHKNTIKCVLANGDLGKKWFTKIGFDNNIIFNWGYFINDENFVKNRQDQNIVSCSESGNIIKFVFVGRLEVNKGIEYLISTFKKISLVNYELHIIGDGSLKKFCKDFQETLGNNKIFLYGTLPMNQISSFLVDKDYLILPSTGKDGWGVVVNEAFQSGLKVILSNNVGSSCLINDDNLGYIFDPKIENSLHKILQKNLLENKKMNYNDLLKVSEFYRKLSTKAAAEYLRNIIDYIFNKNSIRPLAPWKT